MLRRLLLDGGLPLSREEVEVSDPWERWFDSLRTRGIEASY